METQERDKKKFLIMGNRFFPAFDRHLKCALRVLDDGWQVEPKSLSVRMILQRGLKSCAEGCGVKCEFAVD